MNREIKFRAWDEQNKVMHNDFQFVKSGNNSNDWILFVSDKQPINSTDDSLWHNNPYLQQQLKIMQFTGLTDKNRKEIYEGDIIFNEVERWIVVFNRGCFCAKLLSDKRDDNDPSVTHIALRAVQGTEVIGNIYENPELLTK